MKTARNPGRHHCGWGAFALLILVGGCTTLLPAPLADPALHVLTAAPAARATAGNRELVIEVGPPRASPGFDTPRMAYVRKPYALEYFADNRWAEAPARMLGPLLTQALERSEGFRAVVQAPTVVPADVRVNTELIRLQQNFASRPSRVELGLRVQLVDVRARRVLATRSFEEIEAAPTEDAYGGVTAANAALARLLPQVVDFCVVEAARRSGPVGSGTGH